MMHWYDWVIFAACWSLIPGCFVLRAWTERRASRPLEGTQR